MRRGMLILAVLLAALAIIFHFTGIGGGTTTLILISISVILGFGSMIT